jgi:hypothetical protein
MSTASVTRLEQSLKRDKERLQAYYEALLREDTDRQRRSPQLKPEMFEQRKLAVDLELQPKTHELHQRSGMRVQLRPIAVIVTELPALRVRCEVSRKHAKRDVDILALHDQGARGSSLSHLPTHFVFPRVHRQHRASVMPRVRDGAPFLS